MSASWNDLIANLAAIALFTSIWSQLSDWFDNQPWRWRKLYIGTLVGAAAVTTMVMAVEVAPGVLFDLRAAVIAVGAFFSGPVVAAISIALAGGFRAMEGGPGVLVGLGNIALAALFGLAVRAVGRRPLPSLACIFVLGVMVAALAVLTALGLRGTVGDATLAEFIVPTAVLSFLATIMMGLTIAKVRETGRERQILSAAMSQTPEFLYVKDRDSRFVAANAAVARHNGFDHPAEMIGKTDHDLAGADADGHAARLFAQEQEIIRSGTPLLDVEEEMTDAGGDHHWYRTSKVPVRDRDGKVIGLAGVTVETTGLKQLERELTENRDRLSLALSEMSDGLAVFDKEGFLVFCNDQYREAFPLSAHTRVPGAHITDILRACAETGEQLDVPDDIEAWAQRVGSLLRVPNVVTIELFDGRYLQLSNRPASNETAVVMVADVTDIKHAERALIAANANLSRLAATDALTGLPNRRIFDEALERDMARTGRAGKPLGLILLDVDHFKAYNDTYGHPAGDKCLVMIAHTIKSGLHRPGDMAARYGGEEFAVILPETDLAGAIEVAERIRRAVIEASLAQLGTIGTRMSASLGVAEYDLSRKPETPQDLLARADSALYAAKAAGRNRVMADGEPPLEAENRGKA